MCQLSASQLPVIKGVYGNPIKLWDQQGDLGKLGINAVFVRHKLINAEMMHRARSQGILVFAEFATLNGKNYVQEHPEAWAINEKGERVEAASWFMGVCPTEPAFRKYRFDELRELLSTHDIDGVWMDYVHWHAQFEEREPILPETCFCSNCLDTFSKAKGIQLPDGPVPDVAERILSRHEDAWRDWRCEVILEWANEMKTIIKEVRPGTLLGLYHCPWDDAEFNGARRRNLGLDYDLLRETIDVFSPMVYHERMERNPGWVLENITWLCDRLKIKESGFPKVWPIVQALNKNRIVSAEEFETVLRYGQAAQSTGVMMFTATAIADDPQKAAALKQVYMDEECRDEKPVTLSHGVDRSAGHLTCYIVSTPSATYYLEKEGGGLSSMLDKEGIDWMGFHPEEGSGWKGEYRGFPNSIHRQDGSYFHALNAGTELSSSVVEIEADDHVRIVFTSGNNKWEGIWDFYPDRCDFTMSRVSPGYKYWILFEGVPGGEMDPTDFWYSSADRNPHLIGEKQIGDLPGPEWIAFGDASFPRMLYLLNHDDDAHPDDYFDRPYMTVFGFGRSEKEKYLDTPMTFSIGFIESTSYADIEEMAQQIVE